MPPNKSLAVVEFLEPVDARKAFSSLAYRRYHHTPIYLEWAPLAIIVDKKPMPSLASSSSSKKEKNQNRDTDGITSDHNHNTNDAEDDYSTIFIKNLSFNSTEEELKDHIINRCGISITDVRAISLPKKQKNGYELSMGYGFVEFASFRIASNAVTRINGSLLDGHSLEAKPSDKRLSVTKAAYAREKITKEDLKNVTCKLIVRNLAFQANSNELRSLFSTFGVVKQIRIPKKMDGQHRGYAFIDFSTKQEAATAFETLKNTHFYGRHLVIEYAEDSEKEDLDKLRNKAMHDVGGSNTNHSAVKYKIKGILEAKASDISAHL